MNGVAWRRIADERASPNDDLYGGRVPRLRVPSLLLHGAKDPRTEPGELDALRAQLPHAQVAIVEEGGHSPHSERLTADEVTRIARAFLDALPGASDPRNLSDIAGPPDLPEPQGHA